MDSQGSVDLRLRTAALYCTAYIVSVTGSVLFFLMNMKQAYDITFCVCLSVSESLSPRLSIEPIDRFLRKSVRTLCH